MGNLERSYDNQKLAYTKHSIIRMNERKITNADIRLALKNGNIVKDPRELRCNGCQVILGVSVQGMPIHVIVLIKKKECIIITAYYPNAELWESDLIRRKK